MEYIIFLICHFNYKYSQKLCSNRNFVFTELNKYPPVTEYQYVNTMPFNNTY